MENHDDIFDKVLYIGPDLKSRGGMTTVAQQYARGIGRFHYLCTNSHRGLILGLVNLGVCLVRLPIERIRGRKIVHIAYAGSKSWKRKSVIAKLARMLGYKTVMHCHCALPLLASNQGVENTTNLLRAADANIVLANEYQAFAREKLGLVHTEVIPNPIEFTGHGASDPHIPTTFIFLGLLNWDKGIFDIIEAATNLKAQGRLFRVIFGGSGSDSAKLKELVTERNLSDVIEFAGWVEDDKKLQLFSRSHVLLIPSYQEGMPMCILEAKSAGMPVIATPVGAVPDIVHTGRDGFIIGIGDVSALSEAMNQYICNPQLVAEHGANSLKSADNFAFEKIAPKLINTYKRLLK